MPPNEQVKIFEVNKDVHIEQEKYDILIFHNIQELENDLLTNVNIKNLQPWGKIFLSINKNIRDLIIPSKNINCGDKIQIINELVVGSQLHCVFRPPRELNLPVWDKKSNGTILVYSDFGFGDVFLATRYVKYLKNNDRKFIFEARIEEYDLIKNLSYYDDVFIKGQKIPNCDYKIEIMELRDDEMEIEFPYFKDFIPNNKLPKNNKIKVGVVTKGHYIKIGERREVDIDLFKYFPDSVQLYFFQKPDYKHDNIKLPKNSIDLSGYLNNWFDTANYLKQMDYLVTVDTGIMHLAAALGVNVKVLLNIDHFYIKMHDRHSFLYSSNLQAYWGNYHKCINEIIKDIVKYNKIMV